MKKITTTIILQIMFILNVFAQNTEISLNQGYENQSFYSMANGEIVNTQNNNWDIAFSTDAFSSTIRINDGKGVELYTYPLGDTSAWNTIDNNSINILVNPMYNSDTSWELGAFDVNTTNGMDYGWGVYNLATHHIIGDSLFIIKTVDGNWKKLWLEKKVSGEYLFKYANLDGSNMINQNVQASNYNDKRFIYYSLESDLIIDREPILSDWDITFTKYITPVQGMPYSVTGVLSNSGVEIAKVDNIPSPLTYTNYGAHNFTQEINSIGYDWKTFSGTYVIDSDRLYFIRDYQQNIWRLVFTNFDGMSTGNIEFNTELLSATNTNNYQYNNSLELYPNPASPDNNIILIYDIKSNNGVINIYDITGKKLYTTNLTSGFDTHTINNHKLKKGIYIISLVVNGEKINKRLIIN